MGVEILPRVGVRDLEAIDCFRLPHAEGDDVPLELTEAADAPTSGAAIVDAEESLPTVTSGVINIMARAALASM